MKIKFMKFNNREVRLAVFFILPLAAFLIVLPNASYFVSAQDKNTSLRPTVRTADKYDLSPPLRSIKPLLTKKNEKGDDDRGASGPVNNTRHDPDPVVQNTTGNGVFNQENAIPSTGVSFDGMINLSGINPPDPNGDIGPNHYVQMVNSRFQIFTRTGISVFGPASINTLFAGFGGACQNENAGDPVVIYDQFADRWLLSQFTAAGPNYFNCVAISTSSDPTGTYYRYAFGTGANFPDYPKYGVGSNAYFISTREFNGPFAGIGAYALNRAQLLAGNPAPQVISFLLPPGAQPFRTGDGLLPADLDGVTLPPPNSPHYFVGSMDGGGPYSAAADALNLFKFQVDWVTPANSTFTFSNQLNTAAFDSIFTCTPAGRSCIPQPGTTAKIDILSYRQRPTFRLAYRNYGTHESLVTTQSVEATTGLAGMRWWEIRSPNSSPVIYQEGTYAPADAVNRWMGSVAMDSAGNMALAYSVSDAVSVFPGIRYTGRLSGDPLGTMPQGEGIMINGSGSQTGGGNRWGDYSSMNIDPLDDCTFWYTSEYYAATSSSGWRTRISSFKFPGCSAPTAASANISGRALSTTRRGLPGVRLTLTGGNLTEPRYAQTNAFGFYRFVDLPVGVTYTLTIKSKKNTFVPPVQVITLLDNLDDVNFVGSP
ncbi:MAG: carboxypeptidase-like regulatory domain-containing protein [Acidobacteriota bacterium]|nr:carboxypeptidase-like regulatory domain-containing protein [Acidobacteriota bacterium]